MPETMTLRKMASTVTGGSDCLKATLVSSSGSRRGMFSDGTPEQLGIPLLNYRKNEEKFNVANNKF